MGSRSNTKRWVGVEVKGAIYMNFLVTQDEKRCSIGQCLVDLSLVSATRVS